MKNVTNVILDRTVFLDIDFTMCAKKIIKYFITYTTYNQLTRGADRETRKKINKIIAKYNIGYIGYRHLSVSEDSLIADL